MVPTFDHLKIKDAVIQTSALKKDGVYLVFGGMGEYWTRTLCGTSLQQRIKLGN